MWNIHKIAREERGKGKRVWVGFGRMTINDKWWKWDKDEEVIKDERSVGKEMPGLKG